MKCPYCKENHPDDFKFCPVTGKEIPQELLACENEDCIDFGKHILPLDSRFCPRCGAQLKSGLGTSIKNEIFKVGGVEFEMIGVEGGTFWMGAQRRKSKEKNYDSEATYHESPVHEVTLSDYSIGKHLVTQKLWEAVMGSNPSEFIGDTERPVEKVSWYDITNEFLPKLNNLLKDQLDGRHFMLPSEAQWEYAARGGKMSKGFKYSGSDNIDDVAWYNANSGETTHPVGGKKPNELGLFDMIGNVLEWCGDCFGNYSKGSRINPVGPISGPNRMLRGGNWDCGAKHCRVSLRYFTDPVSSILSSGLRLALSSAF